MELAEQFDGAPDGMAEDYCGSGRHGDAEKGECDHRDGQTDGLANDLRLLALCVACEVGDVEAEGCPVSDHRGEGWKEELPEIVLRGKMCGLREHWTEAAGLAHHKHE